MRKEHEMWRKDNSQTEKQRVSRPKNQQANNGAVDSTPSNRFERKNTMESKDKYRFAERVHFLLDFTHKIDFGQLFSCLWSDFDLCRFGAPDPHIHFFRARKRTVKESQSQMKPTLDAGTRRRRLDYNHHIKQCIC